MEKKRQELLEQIRHSLAHLLAAAVKELYPNAKTAIGPSIDSGFYYDFDFGDTGVSEKDLARIEAKMKELLPTWDSFSHRAVSEQEAREIFKGNPYKLELVDEIIGKGEPLTLYEAGDFEDLCRGGHVAHPAQEIAPDTFALDRIAGAYWRGDEKNSMLTRIYGLAFETKEALDAFRAQREEAQQRDHRKLGRELDLFTFSDLVGAGLPLYTPKGTVLRDELARFSEELQAQHGFERVWIPHITKIDLYKTSGHWDKFGDELMLVKSQETDDELALKPMNCPHHTQIYASRARSYRELPIRYMNTTTNYRDEKTGELSGLTRVRSLTQDDGHVFCTIDQVEQEFENIMQMIKTLYTTLGLSFKARLSFRDPTEKDKYLGDDATWETSEKLLAKIADKLGISYHVAEGEAAIYGPKIDIMVTDALGREWQCATEQLDFIQPVRFALEYTAQDGTKQTPVMIHKALLGTIDRFLGVYIEHTGGAFPLWLSPIQVKVLPISESYREYAQHVFDELKAAGIRTELDESNETLGKKIRQGKLEKIPYMLVIGEKEIESHTVTIESRDAGNQGARSPAELIERLRSEIRERA